MVDLMRCVLVGTMTFFHLLFLCQRWMGDEEKNVTLCASCVIWKRLFISLIGFFFLLLYSCMLAHFKEQKKHCNTHSKPKSWWISESCQIGRETSYQKTWRKTLMKMEGA